MTVNILAVGDVCGKPGLDFLRKHLSTVKKDKNISFTVVNGENANVVGITPAQAEEIFAAGADVVTLGNHTWNILTTTTKSSARQTSRSAVRAMVTAFMKQASAMWR